MDWTHPICSKVTAGGRIEAVVAPPTLSDTSETAIAWELSSEEASFVDAQEAVAGAIHVSQLQHSPTT